MDSSNPRICLQIAQNRLISLVAPWMREKTNTARIKIFIRLSWLLGTFFPCHYASVLCTLKRLPHMLITLGLTYNEYKHANEISRCKQNLLWSVHTKGPFILCVFFAFLFVICVKCKEWVLYPFFALDTTSHRRNVAIWCKHTRKHWR